MSIFRRASLGVALLVVVVVSVVAVRKALAATTVLGPTACQRGAGSNLNIEITSSWFKNPPPPPDGVGQGLPVPVTCSLFRDNTTNTNGMQDLEINISNLGASDYTATVMCTAFSYDRRGAFKKSIQKSATISGSGAVTLDWGSSINLSVSKGFYSIFCVLPPNFAIHSIYYQEP
jgi:hypothetical protein